MDSLTLSVQLPKSKICNWEPHSFFGHQHSSISILEHLKTPYEAILEGTSHKNKLPFGRLARSCACVSSEMLSVSSFCTTAFQSCQAIPFSGLYPICSEWIASKHAGHRVPQQSAELQLALKKDSLGTQLLKAFAKCVAAFWTRGGYI